jgi:hypothetical protein
MGIILKPCNNHTEQSIPKAAGWLPQHAFTAAPYSVVGHALGLPFCNINLDANNHAGMTTLLLAVPSCQMSAEKCCQGSPPHLASLPLQQGLTIR